MNENKIKILVIDDEPDMLSGFQIMLSAMGFETVLINNGEEAYSNLVNDEFDLIFTDLLMPNVDGMDIVKAAQTSAPNTPVIIFSAYGTIERIVEAIKLGAFDFLEKPIDTERLKLVIEKGLRQRQLFKEKENLLHQLENKFSFGNIVTRSDSMKKIFEVIENISQTDANVLITGESGTGKELIARSIHAHSNRNTKPFVAVNCGALPENLFESELFGFERGAFTGAIQKKIGLLEYANTGTFFMDEVCEMIPSLQVKLLRVLQEHNLRRVGGTELIKVNFRIISATNRDIEKVLAEEKLRKDFYYRLNVIHIHVPPLRERLNDIALLAEHFLQKYLSKANKKIEGFDEGVISLIESYSWPGNVRELENVVERAVALSMSNKITLDLLPSYLLGKNNRNAANQNAPKSLIEVKQQTLQTLEKNYLTTLLEKYNGNVTKVAEAAGMTRRNVHRLIKLYDINPNDWR